MIGFCSAVGQLAQGTAWDSLVAAMSAFPFSPATRLEKGEWLQWPSSRRLFPPELIARLLTPEWRQEVIKPVMVNLLHQCEQATDLPFWKPLAGEPVKVVAREVGKDCSLVFAEKHDAGNLSAIAFAAQKHCDQRLPLPPHPWRPSSIKAKAANYPLPPKGRTSSYCFFNAPMLPFLAATTRASAIMSNQRDAQVLIGL